MNKKALTFTVAMLLAGTSMGPIPKLTSHANVNLGIENNTIASEISEDNSIANDIAVENTNTVIENHAITNDTVVENTLIANNTLSHEVAENPIETNEQAIENITAVNGNAEETAIESLQVNETTKEIKLDSTNTTDIVALNNLIRDTLTAQDTTNVVITSDGEIKLNNIAFSPEIPAGKSLIWQAKVSINKFESTPLVVLSGSGKFILDGGSIEYKNGTTAISATDSVNMILESGTIKASNNTINWHSTGNFTMNGGEIIASTEVAVSGNSGNITIHNGMLISPDNTINWNSTGNFTMNGGEIKAISNSSVGVQALFYANGSINIKGGTILGFNKNIIAVNSSGIIQNNSSNSPFQIGENVKAIAFDYLGYSPRYYLHGSSSGLKISSNTLKAKWGEEGIMVGDKSITTASDHPGVKIYKLNPPHNIKYGESIAEPKLPKQNSNTSGELIIHYFKKEEMGGLTPLNGNLPTLPGKYEVKGKVDGTGELLPPNIQSDPQIEPIIYIPTEEISLGEFEIQKRNITITPENATIKVNEPLPQFTATLSGDGMANREILGNYRVFTDTDGKTPGVFDIKVELLNDGNYTPEGYDIKLHTGTLTVLAENQTPTPPNQNHHSGGSSNSGGSSGGGSSHRSGGGSGGGSGRRSGGGSGGGSAHTKKTDSKSNEVKGTWISDSKGWQFKHENGTLAKDIWQEISFNNKKDWYFFKNDGYMNTGWLLWNGNWYFLNEASDNNMVKGSMATGWKLISGKWYYFYDKSEGNTIKGSMAKSTTINGYKVDENGAWIQ